MIFLEVYMVEVPMTDHLTSVVSNLEKHKSMQFFSPM